MSRVKRIFQSSFTLLLLTLLAASMVALPGEGDKPAEHHPKIDSALEEILHMAATGRSVSAMDMASRAGVPSRGSSLQVVLELAPQFRGRLAQAVVAAVGRAAPGLVAASSQSFVKVRLPLNPAVLTIVDAILQLSGVAYVRPPAVPQALALSEGVELTGAREYQRGGLRGRGTKIAVIDLGFAGLATAQARGELPSTIHKLDYTGTAVESGTNHGTAVAEIVHDMAPEAELYVMKIGDEVDLERAKDDAIRKGIAIINHSVGWFNTNFYDGRGAVAEIAADARSHGIMWVNAAGNYAQKHWKGYGRDNDRDGWAEFSGNDEDLDLQVRGGDHIQLYLTWNDWPASAQDYDLYLLDGSGQQVALSDRLQTGTEEPVEQLSYRAPRSGTYKVKVKAYRVSSARELALFSLDHDLEYAVPQSSIVAPGNSGSVVTVGAINYGNWTSGPAAPYSSQGPTGDGRSKPDLSGPDQVMTSTLGRFRGTSAAAPHVAGAAALLLSENPSQSVGQVEARLKSQAIAMGSPLVYGAGRLNLAPQIVRRPDLIIANLDYSPRNPAIGTQLSFAVQVSNQGNATAGGFTVEIRDSSGRDTKNIGGLAPGATAQVSFTRQISITNETYTVTADAGDQVAESDEGNNTAQVRVTAASQPPGRPDLVIASFDYSPRNPAIGSQVHFTVQVKNQGDGSAGGFTVEISDSSGRDTKNIAGLSPGRTAQASFAWRIGAASETYTITADARGQVAESNEDNNTLRVRVTAQAAPPPTAPTVRIWADRASYEIGDQLRIGFEVHPRAYLYIYDIDPTGLVSQIFPTSPNQSHYLEGRYSLPDGPYQLRIAGPPGREYLQAIASTSPIELGLDGVRSPGLLDPEAFQSKVARRIGRSGWGIGWTSFQVEGRVPPSNRAPRASFSFSPDSPMVGEPVKFDASGSGDPDGRITGYSWDWDGDGRTDATGVTTTHAFSTAGSHRVTLTVTDDGGLTDTVARTVQVRSAPAPPPSDLPAASLSVDRGCGTTYQPGERITVSYSVSESATMRLFDFTTGGQVTQLLQRSVSSNQRGSFAGQVVGPSGVETLVLFARTTSGTVTSVACSFSIGQVDSSATLGIDRGPNGSYRPGEPIRFTYSVSEEASVVLYDFEPTGAIKPIGLGRISAGDPRSFTATIAGPPGGETAVLVAYTRSGKVLTAAISFRVIP